MEVLSYSRPFYHLYPSLDELESIPDVDVEQLWMACPRITTSSFNRPKAAPPSISESAANTISASNTKMMPEKNAQNNNRDGVGGGGAGGGPSPNNDICAMPLGVMMDQLMLELLEQQYNGDDDDPVCKLEVSPGKREEVRGAEETWLGYQHGRVEYADCKGCGMQLCCIHDAKYVICAGCRHVGLLRAPTIRRLQMAFFDETFVGGVGIGIPTAKLAAT